MKGNNEMNFDINYIERLSKVLTENGLTEISLEDNGSAVTIRKNVIVAPTALTASNIPVSGPSSTVSQTAETAEVKKGTPVISPMVGTFYSAPSPDAKPFVEIGKTVSKGDKVCIIEAMKLMNEIESEVSGKVVELCVQDGQPVEYGQVLMYIEE